MDLTDPAVEAYAEQHTTPLGEHLQEVAATTRDLLGRRSGMMVGHLAGSFLATLVAVSGATRVLEIGTFTGYSALSMAAALPPGGRIVTCEVNEEHAEVARASFAGSPLGDRIELRTGPALDTVAQLDGPFDLVFIDADKTGYDAYFEAVLAKLAPSGCIVFDNVLWSGRVLGDDPTDDESTVALRALNDKLAADPRVRTVLLPIRDGMTIVRPV